MQIKFLTVLLLMTFYVDLISNESLWERWLLERWKSENKFNWDMRGSRADWIMRSVNDLQVKTRHLNKIASRLYSQYYNEHINALYYPSKAQERIDELIVKGAERNEEIRQKAEDIGADIILPCLAGIDEHFKPDYEQIREDMDNCAINAVKRANETFKKDVLDHDSETKQADQAFTMLVSCVTAFNWTYFNPCMKRLNKHIDILDVKIPTSIKAKIHHIPKILDKLDKEMEECLNGDSVKKLINDDVVEVAECAAIESGKNIFDEFTGKVFN